MYNQKIIMLFLGLITIIANAQNSNAPQYPPLQNSRMVQEFYRVNKQKLYWFESKENIQTAKEWIAQIESGDSRGIVPDKTLTEKLLKELSSPEIKKESTNVMKTDWQLTTLILSYIKYLQQGNIPFGYDEVSVSHNADYIHQLIDNKNKSVSKLVMEIDCKDHDYLILKNYLHDSLTTKDTLKYKIVQLAMNYRRYLSVNKQTEYVLVNIPEAEAYYVRNDSLKIQMKTVVGKKTTPTPIFASYITYIVTFPQWNIPHSIAVKELLPKLQKNDNYLEQHNIEVIDNEENTIDDSEINWKKYTAKNFPFYFRQLSGAGNAMGVLKFNLHNPYSIFLHSTNQQKLFAESNRFRSHGCIRLEKPFELAKNLLRGKIDMEKLRRGKANTKPLNIRPPHKIPVFIIYLPLKIEADKIRFMPDIYGIMKQ